MIKQLLNSAIAKYRDLSVARRSIICLCLRHRQIIDLLATDKSRYFAQPRPIIVYYKHEFYNDPMLFNYGSKLKPNMTQNNLPTMLPIDNLLVTKNLFCTAK